MEGAQPPTSAPITIQSKLWATIRAQAIGISRSTIASFFDIELGVINGWYIQCADSLDPKNPGDDSVGYQLYNQIRAWCLAEPEGDSSVFTSSSYKMNEVLKRYPPITSSEVYDVVKTAKNISVPTKNISKVLKIDPVNVRKWSNKGHVQLAGFVGAAQRLYDDMKNFVQPNRKTCSKQLIQTLAEVEMSLVTRELSFEKLRVKLELTNKNVQHVVKKAIKDGYSVGHIATCLGKSTGTIYEWRKRNPEEEIPELEENAQILYDIIVEKSNMTPRPDDAVSQSMQPQLSYDLSDLDGVIPDILHSQSLTPRPDDAVSPCSPSSVTICPTLME